MPDTIQQLLRALEAELKQLQLWSASPPDIRALESTLPFCCDTLPLEQWLQFIFLPRMQALIDARLNLPGKIGILPIAEEAFKQHGESAAPLLRIIARIDTHVPGAK